MGLLHLKVFDRPWKISAFCSGGIKLIGCCLKISVYSSCCMKYVHLQPKIRCFSQHKNKRKYLLGWISCKPAPLSVTRSYQLKSKGSWTSLQNPISSSSVLPVFALPLICGNRWTEVSSVMFNLQESVWSQWRIQSVLLVCLEKLLIDFVMVKVKKTLLACSY